MAAALAVLVLLLTGSGVRPAVVTSTPPTALALRVNAQRSAQSGAQLAAAACACAAATGGPCCACAPALVASTPAPAQTHVLYVDEDSDSDAIKEAKDKKKPAEVPEIVSFAGYHGDTVDDLPIVPRRSNVNRKFDNPSNDELYFIVKPLSTYQSRLDSAEDISVWEIKPGASTAVYVRTVHSPFVKKLRGPLPSPPVRPPSSIGVASPWRPSNYPNYPNYPNDLSPPRGDWVFPGDTNPYGRPRPWSSSYPNRVPTNSFRPSFNPSTNRFPQYPPVPSRPSFVPTRPSFVPNRPSFVPTRPPYAPTTTTQKTVRGVKHKLDWSGESGEDSDDKKGTGDKNDGVSFEDERKVITVIDKLDLDQFAR